MIRIFTYRKSQGVWTGSAALKFGGKNEIRALVFPVVRSGLCGREAKFEPSPPDVGSMKRDPMTIENDVLREELFVQMKQPQLGFPEYWADPVVLRRPGRVLSEISERVRPEGRVPTNRAC